MTGVQKGCTEMDRKCNERLKFDFEFPSQISLILNSHVLYVQNIIAERNPP